MSEMTFTQFRAGLFRILGRSPAARAAAWRLAAAYANAPKRQQRVASQELRADLEVLHGTNGHD